MSFLKRLLRCNLNPIFKTPRLYSSLYSSDDLCGTATIPNSWSKELLAVKANRVTGLTDFSVVYGKDSDSKFWISSSCGSDDEMNLALEDGETIAQISAGRCHMVILTSHGHVYTCGDHGDHGSSKKFVSCKPVNIPIRFRQVVCGLDHTLMLTCDGRVFSCGWGGDGQTGSGDETNLTDFTPVVGEICSKNIANVYTGADSSFALADDGVVFAWGNNEYGQLAVNTDDIQMFTPQPCHLSLSSERVVDIASGGAFTCFLTASGSVYYLGNVLGFEDKLSVLYETNTETGPVMSLYAGLHYVVACCQETLLIWGQYPTAGEKPQPLKMSAPAGRIYSVSPRLRELVLLLDE